MIERIIRLGRWEIDFIFAPDGYDDEEVLTRLYDMDASYDIMRRVNRIMDDGKMNRGFTFANPEMRKALSVVGPASSGGEFLNTLAHESYHVAAAVANELGAELDGEEPAYLIGESFLSLLSVVCELGCKHCN